MLIRSLIEKLYIKKNSKPLTRWGPKGSGIVWFDVFTHPWSDWQHLKYITLDSIIIIFGHYKSTVNLGLILVLNLSNWSSFFLGWLINGCLRKPEELRCDSLDVTLTLCPRVVGPIANDSVINNGFKKFMHMWVSTLLTFTWWGWWLVTEFFILCTPTCQADTSQECWNLKR